jgi:exopolyphosphatase/guanosine-5'-triphosphate,3'-diphosphate pyrophosphatase
MTPAHSPRPQLNPSRSLVLAGIDIGTLTCRLLIAQVSDDGHLTELHSNRRIVRLGEGLDRTRRLLPAAISRVIATLREWRSVIESHRVEGEIVVATSAVREATNRDEFLASAKREAGMDVEVISGTEEARRTMLGLRSGLPPEVSALLGLDIGGGSTEFILDRPGHPLLIRSIEMGVVRLTDRLLTHDPPTGEDLRSARQLIRAAVDEVRPVLGDLRDLTFVGTAGTVTTLAAMALRLPAYEGARIHNYRLSLETVAKLEEELLTRTLAERRGMPGLEAGREDVIVAGTLMLKEIMERLGFSDCLVSDLGLREGIVLDLASRLRARET